MQQGRGQPEAKLCRGAYSTEMSLICRKQQCNIEKEREEEGKDAGSEHVPF